MRTCECPMLVTEFRNSCRHVTQAYCPSQSNATHGKFVVRSGPINRSLLHWNKKREIAQFPGSIGQGRHMYFVVAAAAREGYEDEASLAP